MISLSRTDGARKDLLELCTHTPRKQSTIDVYTEFPWDSLCAEVAKLKIHRDLRGEVVPIRRAVNADVLGPEEEPGKAGSKSSMIPSELATPLATPDGNHEEWTVVGRWRRRESNPGPKTPCSCLYVRSRRTESPRVAPIGGLSSALSACLISPCARWPGGRLASLVTPFRRRWQASRSDDSQICCLGSESNCVIVRNYRCPGGFTWVLSHHGTQQKSSASPSKPFAPLIGSEV